MLYPNNEIGRVAMTHDFDEYLKRMEVGNWKPEQITSGELRTIAYNNDFTIQDYYERQVKPAIELDDVMTRKLELFRASIPWDIFERLIFSYVISQAAEKILMANGRTTKRLVETMQNDSI